MVAAMMGIRSAERALFTARRKEAYEALHPETKHGAIGDGHNQSRQVGDSAERFTADTARKTGQSERKVQRDAEPYRPVQTRPVLSENERLRTYSPNMSKI